MKNETFWQSWEKEVGSFAEVQEKILSIHRAQENEDRLFAWRGAVNADWSLHSSLYRRLLWTLNKIPTERDLWQEEGEILKSVHRWGLHFRDKGRMPILAQLATLQHYGAPTRLIDITFNPWVGLWFATEQKWANGQEVHADTDGRLFVFDVTSRLINENHQLRKWGDATLRPWPLPFEKKGEEPARYQQWQTQTFAWRPPHFDPRIAAQNGGFLIGGVPGPKMRWSKGPGRRNDHWRIDEVRQATSLALQVQDLRPAGKEPRRNGIFTLRIRAEAKAEIRSYLQGLFGYKHSVIYPDFPGFADFGTPHLKSSP